jgi:hypothetical protein
MLYVILSVLLGVVFPVCFFSGIIYQAELIISERKLNNSNIVKILNLITTPQKWIIMGMERMMELFENWMDKLTEKE